MKVKFVTTRANRQAFENDLAGFRTKSHLSLKVRDHAKDPACIWIEMENNKDQMQDNLRGYLKKREREKMLRSLSIYEFDGMGRPTVNGVPSQEAKAQ